MRVLNIITFILLVVGGLNWGLVGLFDFDLVTALLGNGAAETATSSALAVSRSQTTASAPAFRTSAAWAGFLISPTAWSPRSAMRRSSRSAIFPCPPAITTRMPPAYLPGSSADYRDHGQAGSASGVCVPVAQS